MAGQRPRSVLVRERELRVSTGLAIEMLARRRDRAAAWQAAGEPGAWAMGDDGILR